MPLRAPLNLPSFTVLDLVNLAVREDGDFSSIWKLDDNSAFLDEDHGGHPGLRFQEPDPVLSPVDHCDPPSAFGAGPAA